MINIIGLHKSFAKNKVLKGIDVSFLPGNITAILGPNGSGKTTLIKSILGMVLADKGEIEINAKNIKGQWAYRDQLNYLPQIARFPENLKVKELIAMIKDLRKKEADDKRLIELFDLEAFLPKKLKHLSGGTRQKVNLVLAFMYDSPILILDEPTAGLDPLAIQILKKLIQMEKQKEKIILFTTHIMSLVDELADEVAFILDGEIFFQGKIENLKEQHQSDSTEEAIACILKRNQSQKLLDKIETL